MMEQTALKTLKLQIQHDIAEKAQAFYVDFCRLLEFMLKHLGEQYHFMWNTASLSEMADIFVRMFLFQKRKDDRSNNVLPNAIVISTARGESGRRIAP